MTRSHIMRAYCAGLLWICAGCLHWSPYPIQWDRSVGDEPGYWGGYVESGVYVLTRDVFILEVKDWKRRAVLATPDDSVETGDRRWRSGLSMRTYRENPDAFWVTFEKHKETLARRYIEDTHSSLKPLHREEVYQVDLEDFIKFHGAVDAGTKLYCTDVRLHRSASGYSEVYVVAVIMHGPHRGLRVVLDEVSTYLADRHAGEYVMEPDPDFLAPVDE